MNTAPILSQTPATTGTMQAVKQADVPSSDGTFNQVLSREIASRDNSGENKSTNTTSKEATSTATPPQSSSKAASKTAEKEKSGDSADKDQSDEDTATGAASAPADMLALVANLAQIAAAKPDAAATASNISTGAEQPDPKLASAGKVDWITHNDAKELIASAQTSNNPAKDTKAVAVNSDSEFANLIKHAGESKQSIDLPSTVKTQELQPTLTAAVLTNIQQASVLTGVQAMPGHATEKLTPQVGTPAWDQALGQKVVWMVAGSQQSASLTLNPPDLGPLQVVLNVSNSQANATFIAAQPEVRQALEAAMPKLREMMGEAGIQLGQATVSTGTPNHNGNHSGEQSRQSSRSFGGGTDTNETTIRVTQSRSISSGQGLVDTFA